MVGIAVDWTDVASVRKALASGRAAYPLSDVDGWNRSHRQTLSLLAPKELALLVKVIAEITVNSGVGAAAYALGEENDLASSLRLWDALATVSFEDVDPTTPVNATYFLLCAMEQSSKEFTPARARRYLKRWSPTASENTAFYRNAALLHVALGEHAEAVACLRQGVLAGNPNINSRLDAPDLRVLKGTPGFSELKKLKPIYPTALRQLQMAISLDLDESVDEAAMDCDLEWIYGALRTPEMCELGPAGERIFRCFGKLPDGGELVFWEITEGLPLLERPIALFGSEGKLSVVARDFDGFLCLLGHGLRLHNVEREGFLAEAGFVASDTEWTRPTGGGLPKLRPKKAFLAQLVKWSRGVAKRKPQLERAAALELVPRLMTTLQALTGPKAKPKTKPKAKAKSKRAEKKRR